MDYGQGYRNATSLAQRIRESAASGQTVKGGSGLASRLRTSDTNESLDYSNVVAQYVGYVGTLFQPLREEQMEQETASYLDAPTSSPLAKRNPENWKDAPLMGSISTEVTDENIRGILAALKQKESSGDYTVQNPTPGQTASGGYGFIDDTWQSLSKKYGIGTEYSSAKDAPPEVQDALAASYVKDILAENNNDVTKVPLVWYTGNAQGKISAKALEVNKGLTPAQYQNDWMRRYNKITGVK
jgi:hypothetical protein